MKIKTSKRLLCALLTVLLVLPTLLAGTLLTTSAASVTYTVTSASSGSISYIGKNYTTGASNQSLSFELNSGFTMSGSDGSTWYATCIYAGRADPPIGTQFSERYGIGSTTFTDGLLQGTEKGPHYVVNASSSVSPSATNYDPMVGYGREVSASFVFSCWYWAYQYQNRYSGVTFDNNLLQEAVAIAYRYEYDTRLIKYGNTFHKWADWQQKDGRSTYWQQTPYSQWRTDTNHFSRATSNASIVDAANAILDAKANVRYCRECYTLTDHDICPVCANTNRDHGTIMVVENARDLAAYEKTGKYEGVYHVLHGAISPMLGIGPNDIRLKELMQRLEGEVKEVIIATNSSLEGETTAMYISKLIKPTGIRVTRIASGVPVGGDLEYIDEVTLLRALEGRVEL